MKRNGLYGRRCLAVGLLVVVLNGALSGCAMPEDFAGILRPVEEVVSTVRQNMELRQQMKPPGTVMLAKASHAMKFEWLVERLRET